MNALSGKTVIVVGASRGLGRGIAGAFAKAGSEVVAVARTEFALPEFGSSEQKVHIELADATDATAASDLVGRYRPQVLVLVAGAIPSMEHFHLQTWETFCVNWESDVKIAFNWLQEVLLKPLEPGSRVVVVSSGAALVGSPLSGGYAGSKATQRLMAEYTQYESDHAGLGISVTTVMPTMTEHGNVGLAGVGKYSAVGGQTEEEFIEQLGLTLTPEVAGAAVVDLVLSDPSSLAPAYKLAGDGLHKLP